MLILTFASESFGRKKVQDLKGAEATVRRINVLGQKAVIKVREPKTYRNQKLDEKLRRERTRIEARLLHKAKLAGVFCPTALEVDDFEITMTFISGKRIRIDKKTATESGKILALLHQSNIIHGDYTPANLIQCNKKIAVIDFGLGFVSNEIEDKAVDVFTMLRVITEPGTQKAFIKGYETYQKSKSVLERVNVVEKRVRYAI